MYKSQKMWRIEESYGKALPALLTELFDRLHTAEAVCAELDISHRTLVDWLDQFGLERVRQIRHITTLRARDEALASTG